MQVTSVHAQNIMKESKKLDKTLHYKGCKGTVVLEPDGFYTGVITHIEKRQISDHVGYDGETLEELNENFKNTVDFYIRLSEQENHGLSETMFYGGYIGLAYKEKDGTYSGRIAGTDDTVMFKGDTLADIQDDFRQ